MKNKIYLITFPKENPEELYQAQSIFEKYGVEYNQFKYLNGFGFSLDNPDFYLLGFFEKLISLPDSKLEQTNNFHTINSDSIETKLENETLK